MEEETIKKIREGLEEISQGVGAFNRDQLRHAENVITGNKEKAKELLDLINSKEKECEKCGGELGNKLVGDETVNYCSECNWVTS